MRFTTVVYKSALVIWKINPLKKATAIILRKLNIPHRLFYKDLKFNGFFTVKIEGLKFKMRNHPSADIENEIFWEGIYKGWEKQSLKAWIIFCRNATVILDIGANTGIYSLIASVVNKDARVFCFEPSIKVYKRLKENLLKNNLDSSIALNIAVSNVNGFGKFYDFPGDYNLSASLNIEKSKNETLESLTYDVKTMRIDTFIKENKIEIIDLVKIDVEMHEPEVIEGFGKTLDLFHPVILIEVLTNEIADKLNTLLKHKNYSYYTIDENKGFFPAETIKLQSEGNWNWLLIPKNKLEFFRSAKTSNE